MFPIVPIYPPEAIKQKIEGWVVVAFSISPEGTVVAESIEVDDAQPKGVFDASAMDAASKLTFPPLSISGQLRSIPCYLHVFRYELAQAQQQLNEDSPPSPTQ